MTLRSSSQKRGFVRLHAWHAHGLRVHSCTDTEYGHCHPADEPMYSLASVPLWARVFKMSHGGLLLDIQKPKPFTRNLEVDAFRFKDPDNTAGFWKKFPKAWAAHRENPLPKKQVMEEYRDWLAKLEKHCNNTPPIFTAGPLSSDWVMVHHYCMEYLEYNPYGYGSQTVDMDSYVCGALHLFPLEIMIHKKWPTEWLSNLPHSHVALDDALVMADELEKSSAPYFGGEKIWRL